MSAFKSKMIGFPELGKAIAQMQGPVVQKMCTRAVAKGAQVVKKAVIARAPVLDRSHLLQVAHGEYVLIPPGNLKKNVITKKVKSDLMAEYIVTVQGKVKGTYAARYARLVEFGTVNFEPKPFMRPAFDESSEGAVEAIRLSLEESISKANSANNK